MTAFHSFHSRKLLGLVLLAGLLSFFCATLMPQEKSQQPAPRSGQEPPAVLKMTTRLVTVDVVARDHKGNAVRDLNEIQITAQSASGKSQQRVATFRLLDRALAECNFLLAFTQT